MRAAELKKAAKGERGTKDEDQSREVARLGCDEEEHDKKRRGGARRNRQEGQQFLVSEDFDGLDIALSMPTSVSPKGFYYLRDSLFT